MAIHGHDFRFAKAPMASKFAPGEFVILSAKNVSPPPPMQQNNEAGGLGAENLKNSADFALQPTVHSANRNNCEPIERLRRPGWAKLP